LNEIANQKHI